MPATRLTRVGGGKIMGMGSQRRVAGLSISVAVIVVESMIPGLSPWIGLPIVVLCIFGLVTSLAPERVRSTVHRMGVLDPVMPHIDWAIDWVIGIDLSDQEQIPGYEALQMYAEARPNSYETTALNLADKACLGDIKAWGRPRPKMVLPDHVAAVKPIPPHIWEYAVIDVNLVNGPLPRSDMTYRQEYVKPYLKDDRILYEAVRFNKKEMIEICRAESISASKRPAKPGS